METERFVIRNVPILVGQIYEGVWAGVVEKETGTAGTSEASAEEAAYSTYEKRRAELVTELNYEIHKLCNPTYCTNEIVHTDESEKVLEWADRRRWHPYVRPTKKET